MEAEQLRNVGLQIVAAREAKGWTQRDLSKQTGFTDNTIRKIERGERVAPGTLRTVREKVGIDPDQEAVERAGYPRDVQALVDLVAMYLLALPEGERPAVAYEVTRLLMNRGTSTP
jgi:transcriptional regulator with XRE-family HTH domain